MLTRSYNPVWLFDDLVGNILDDSYYMFTLSNTIPYLPVVIYHDAARTVPWSDPIQFNANGTLPIDMYFDSDTVYRLEIRAGDTQADELIYWIDDYIPGSGGGSPSSNSANNTTNQITNPQFSQVNFSGTYTSSASSITDIAPGWDIVTTGSGPGSISVMQLEVIGTAGYATNPSYALQIVSSGWDTVGIKQTFEDNGALWASGANDDSGVALIIIAYNSAGTAPPLSGVISYAGTDAPGPTTIFSQLINSAPNSYGGASALPISTNSAAPGSASTSVTFSWTSNNTVVVTSAQLIGQQDASIAEVAYQQETLERQIDHLYHLAYPIVPVGTIIDFGGFATPEHYMLCDGTALNRTTFSLLFNALTKTETVSLTSTVNTFTVVSAADYHIGMAIEGTGISAATTISGITGTTITMSAVATATTASSVRFFAWGPGNGTTTFNTPDLRGYITAGANGSLFGSGMAAVGRTGGSDANTLSPEQLPPHSHTFTVYTAGTTGNSAAVGNATNVQGTVTTNNGPGVPDPFSIVQQTALVKKFIRFE